MNRILMSMLVLIAVACGAMPAKAVTISYSTSGSVAQVFLTPTSTGDIGYPPNSAFQLNEVLTFGNTKHGSYGEAYAYIPFTVSSAGFLSATVSDLSLTNAGAKTLEWLSLALYEYTGSGMSYLGCDSGSSLCTLDDYAGDSTAPHVASVYSALVAGTQYLLQIGFGLCGCSGQFGGINLTVATTPIPSAMLLFVSALLGMGGVAWRRRRAEVLA
jgi:hypothetical protein